MGKGHYKNARTGTWFYLSFWGGRCELLIAGCLQEEIGEDFPKFFFCTFSLGSQNLGLIWPFFSWLRNSENTICVWKDVSQLYTVSSKSTVTLWGSQFWTCDQEPLQLITSCSKQELRCKWGLEQLSALVLWYVVLVKVLRNVISSPVNLPQPLVQWWWIGVYNESKRVALSFHLFLLNGAIIEMLLAE
jgi:hypothetical protein